ncbi:MAG: hypothetical protein WCF57_05970 [Pyrinomonadaceae bacterium]
MSARVKGVNLLFKLTFVIAALALVYASGALSCFANRLPHSSSSASIQTQTQEKRALKFDEYDSPGGCELGARLDNFALQLSKEPNSKGYIVVYDGRDTLPARRGIRELIALDYLINMRGMDPNRLVAIKGGDREMAVTELWIAPADAPAPEPSDTIIIKKEPGKAYQYDEAYPTGATVDYDQVDYNELYLSVAENLPVAPQQETAPAQDSLVEQPEQTQETIIADPDGAENEDYLWASAGYARALDAEQADACIIYYARRENGHLFSLQQIVETGRNLLVKEHGIKEERIKTIFGGYRESTTVELWVVPPGASLPALAPEYERPNVDEQ